MSRLKKFNIILGAVNFTLLAVTAILIGRISLLEGKYAADSAKSAWDGGKYEYSQVSVYLPRKAAVDVMGVYSLRSSAEAKLKEASLAADKENTDGRLWLDCASGESELTLEGKQKRITFIAEFIRPPVKLVGKKPLHRRRAKIARA